MKQGTIRGYKKYLKRNSYRIDYLREEVKFIKQQIKLPPNERTYAVSDYDGCPILHTHQVT